MARRVSMPTADDLFRPTAVRAVTEEDVNAAGTPEQPGKRRPSGRVRPQARARCAAGARRSAGGGAGRGGDSAASLAFSSREAGASIRA